MAEPTIQLGNGNWAGKSDSLLGFSIQNGRFYEQEFTFNRTTTGTYTDKDGYIQEMPYNLLQQSNDFDTTWIIGASALDLTSGQSGYDGSNDAWLLKKNTSGSRYIQQSITRPSGQYSFSVYLKAESTDWVYIWAYDGSTTVNAYFDLNNGIVGNTSGLDSTNVVSVGNGWYRCTITFTQAITSVRIYPAYANGSISTGTDNGIYIQNAQVNKGTSAKTYFPTTTRLNMPRVDYLNNSNGSLILEPQRSNLVNYSSDFSEWDISTESTSTMTVTPNYTTAQNGLSASRLVATRPSTDFRSIISNYVTNTNTATKSVYIKNNNAGNVDINISDQAITVTDTWQRYELTNNYPHATIGLRYAGAALSCDISIAGYQFELGSYATSYIPTSGSSVTRNADACTDGGDALRFNDNEGVLFFEAARLNEADTSSVIISINDGSLTNCIALYYNSSGIAYDILNSTGERSGSFSMSATNQANFNKVALKYKNQDISLFVNGVKVDVNSGTLSLSGLNSLEFNHGNDAFDFYGKVKQLKVYDTALSDTELAILTGGTATVYNWVDSSSNRIINENGDTIIFT